MKKFIFNAVVYGLLLWSVLTGVYAVLPQETKDLIPQFNELTALIRIFIMLSGASAAIVGSGGLVYKSWLAKAATESDDKYADIVKKFITVTEKYKELENQYKRLESIIKESDQKSAEQIKTLTTLLKAELKAKRDDELIDKKVREYIGSILDEKETDL